MRAKRFRIPLSEGNILDVKIKIKDGDIKDFALNLRCKIKDEWHEVYRVDTAHGYLHEQRYWISPEPISLMQHVSLQYAFEFYMEQIRNNFERYSRHYLEKIMR